MTYLISTNPASNYNEIGRIKISTDSEIADKVAKARSVKTYWKELADIKIQEWDGRGESMVCKNFVRLK